MLPLPPPSLHPSLTPSSLCDKLIIRVWPNLTAASLLVPTIVVVLHPPSDERKSYRRLQTVIMSDRDRPRPASNQSTECFAGRRCRLYCRMGFCGWLDSEMVRVLWSVGHRLPRRSFFARRELSNPWRRLSILCAPSTKMPPEGMCSAAPLAHRLPWVLLLLLLLLRENPSKAEVKGGSAGEDFILRIRLWLRRYEQQQQQQAACSHCTALTHSAFWLTFFAFFVRRAGTATEI